MGETIHNQIDDEKTQSLKKFAAIVYFCHILAFALAGVPLLVGLIINFMKRADVAGTWLESHFNWQVNSTLILFAGIALSGLTMSTGFGLYILIPFVMVFLYRLGIGWYALNADRPVKQA
ncbi:MAG TPA: hypothetical protein ENJ32_08475 [Crenotrichaceae bacterium]|nr:hypothetical protein [Crenotrichaceae bacterium]